jgi:hypothetical protein
VIQCAVELINGEYGRFVTELDEVAKVALEENERTYEIQKNRLESMFGGLRSSMLEQRKRLVAGLIGSFRGSEEEGELVFVSSNHLF